VSYGNSPFWPWYVKVDHGDAKALARGAWDEALERGAREVEAAGCICFFLPDEPVVGAFSGRFAEQRNANGNDVVEIHDPRCPVALADKLRGMES